MGGGALARPAPSDTARVRPNRAFAANLLPKE